MLTPESTRTQRQSFNNRYWIISQVTDGLSVKYRLTAWIQQKSTYITKRIQTISTTLQTRYIQREIFKAKYQIKIKTKQQIWA